CFTPVVHFSRIRVVMRRPLFLIIVFFILPTVRSSCPDNWNLVRDGECRKCPYHSPTLAFDDVISTTIVDCNKYQAQPIIIHNEEHQSYWKQQAAWNEYYTTIALTCNWNTKKWEWVDGSPLDYAPPAYDSELDGECKSACIWIINKDTGHWNINCDGKPKTIQICCIAQLEQIHCEGFYDNSEDGPCYQIGPKEEKWQDAQKTCQNLGADLASIHTQNENSFVRRLAVSSGNVKGLFLGATIEGKGDGFGWIDGTAWDYQNFYAGFPVSGLGDCIVLDTEGSSGQWVNTDCNSLYSFVCVNQLIEPVCSEGPWKEGEAILTPGFPFNASVPCDYMLSVEPGKRVEVQIQYLEANSCCDQLIIYDGYVGGSIKGNYTGARYSSLIAGTSSSNFMRVSWQPNGGVNVRGAVFSFKAI
ncbi:hypothetical protein PENTCL1PPCAC_5080, partial [Pristionchus entomophagus]